MGRFFHGSLITRHSASPRSPRIPLPPTWLLRLVFAAIAFGAAMNAGKVAARVIGFVWLLLTGGGLLIVGLRHGTPVDLVLGVAILGAAGYSWWFTRHGSCRPGPMFPGR